MFETLFTSLQEARGVSVSYKRTQIMSVLHYAFGEFQDNRSYQITFKCFFSFLDDYQEKYTMLSNLNLRDVEDDYD